MMLSSNQHAVIGLGFGDEGKGSVVNHLCRNLDSFTGLVIRFNGGHQAGHTVWLPDGRNHVFSNFGSGTFQGVPTYWSKFCTIDPVGIYNEYQVLKSKGVTPKLYIDVRCPVTTPCDKVANQRCVDNLDHGSCGVGFGKTLKREKAYYSLLAGDLLFHKILDNKYYEIENYYQIWADELNKEFLKCCKFIIDCPDIELVDGSPHDNRDTIIYEGAQGLMLDQHYGFFPHVTPSNTGSKNIIALGGDPKYHVVTRAFQTRHGNGPMTNCDIDHKIKLDKNETNVNNKYQGEFKHSILDVELLEYVLCRDDGITNPNLMMTCLDLVKEDDYRYTYDDRIRKYPDQNFFANSVGIHLNAHDVFISNSKEGMFEIV